MEIRLDRSIEKQEPYDASFCLVGRTRTEEEESLVGRAIGRSGNDDALRGVRVGTEWDAITSTRSVLTELCRVGCCDPEFISSPVFLRPTARMYELINRISRLRLFGDNGE
jgi:hypothetical protein